MNRQCFALTFTLSDPAGDQLRVTTSCLKRGISLRSAFVPCSIEFSVGETAMKCCVQDCQLEAECACWALREDGTDSLRAFCQSHFDEACEASLGKGGARFLVFTELDPGQNEAIFSQGKK